jgi:hypothetical protein
MMYETGGEANPPRTTIKKIWRALTLLLFCNRRFDQTMKTWTRKVPLSAAPPWSGAWKSLRTDTDSQKC